MTVRTVPEIFSASSYLAHYTWKCKNTHCQRQRRRRRTKNIKCDGINKCLLCTWACEWVCGCIGWGEWKESARTHTHTHSSRRKTSIPANIRCSIFRFAVLCFGGRRARPAIFPILCFTLALMRNAILHSMKLQFKFRFFAAENEHLNLNNTLLANYIALMTVLCMRWLEWWTQTQPVSQSALVCVCVLWTASAKLFAVEFQMMNFVHSFSVLFSVWYFIVRLGAAFSGKNR